MLSLVCNISSQFPVCHNDSCICSKALGLFERGDGTSQGSCESSQHKCQSDGQCNECINDSQCTGLSNNCFNNICVCGESSQACDSTLSNECRNDTCMCGDKPQCSQIVQDVVSIADGAPDCDSSKCSYYSPPPITNILTGQTTVAHSCKVQRGPELCEKITRNYNPLYAGKAVNSNRSSSDNACDDGKGKYLGTYQCLGNTIITSHPLKDEMRYSYRNV